MCEAVSAHPLRYSNNRNVYKTAPWVDQRPYEKYKPAPSEKPGVAPHNTDPRGSIGTPCKAYSSIAQSDGVHSGRETTIAELESILSRSGFVPPYTNKLKGSLPSSSAPLSPLHLPDDLPPQAKPYASQSHS
ncbi:hypothetical protein BHE74_00018244 [Ensete ventricosum]|nr:hypothetical protein BHE74_00018244 [Ensete ventricosum]